MQYNYILAFQTSFAQFLSSGTGETILEILAFFCRREVVKNSTAKMAINRVFHKLDEIGNDANIGIKSFITRTKNTSNKILPPVRIEPRTSDSKYNNLISQLT